MARGSPRSEDEDALWPLVMKRLYRTNPSAARDLEKDGPVTLPDYAYREQGDRFVEAVTAAVTAKKRAEAAQQRAEADEQRQQRAVADEQRAQADRQRAEAEAEAEAQRARAEERQALLDRRREGYSRGARKGLTERRVKSQERQTEAERLLEAVENRRRTHKNKMGTHLSYRDAVRAELQAESPHVDEDLIRGWRSGTPDERDAIVDKLELLLNRTRRKLGLTPAGKADAGGRAPRAKG